METIEYTVTEPHGPDASCRGTVADLMLDAHMIPPCGLIPPFRVVAVIMRSGGSQGGMSPGCVWQPMELSEDDYWNAVERLERLTPDEITGRQRDPHITGAIRPDYSAPETDDYLVWLDSLVQRGFLPGGPFRQVSR